MDRFDMVDMATLSPVNRFVAHSLKRWRAARFIGHILTPSTLLFAIKQGA